MRMGSKFVWKQIFLGGNFGEQALEEEILLVTKILGRILASQSSFWEEKNTGEQNVLESKDMGSENFGEQTIFWGGKIW